MRWLTFTTSLTRAVLFVTQLIYVGHLFSGDPVVVNAAASVGSHFILNNLLHFAFVMLFVRSHFAWAEVILIINFINLSSLYFRHNSYVKGVHFGAVSGPLAWTFVAIYWNGAIMVPHPHTLVARIFGNVFIWSILVYGWFFIAVYKVNLVRLKMLGASGVNSFPLGLHNGLQPECSHCCHRGSSIQRQDVCPPMDLCLYHHGGFVRIHGDCCRTGMDGQRAPLGPPYCCSCRSGARSPPQRQLKEGCLV